MQKIRDTVYNEPQKTEFIQSDLATDNRAASAMTLFRATAPMEYEKGADLCTFNAEELGPVLERACGMRIRSVKSKRNILMRYLQWCVANSKPGAVYELENAEASSDEMVRSRLVRNPEHLQVCLNRVFDPEDEGTQENTMRFFFWMAYGGMPMEQIVKVTGKDIHFETMTAERDGNIAVLYRQGLPAIRNCMEMKQFLYKNPAYVNSGDIYRDRVPGDELIRGVRGTPCIKNFRSQLSRTLNAKRNAGIQVDELTYKRVWLSGVCYRLFEGEQAGLKPNFYALAIESYGGAKGLSEESVREKRKTINSIAYGFRMDYERWKNAGAAL